jgi:hypothetical protein
MPSTTERRARTISTLALVGIGALYAATAARYVLGGDNGELVAVGFSDGIAHPPGYPLYILLLGASRIVPASSPAHAAALVTVAIATASVGALAWAARAWGASRLSALSASALYAASPLAWILGTHAEVFALNVLLAMGIVGLSAPASGAPLGREALRAFALALLAGLGLSNHHTIVLLVPLGLYAFVRSARAGGVRAIALGAVGLVLGLTPYLSLSARAASLGAGVAADACSWGNPRGWDGLLHHFLRRDYGTFSLGLSDAEPAPLAHVAALAKTLFFDLCGAPIVLFVALGLVFRRRPRPHLGAWAALVASFVICGPLFVARFNLPATGIATHIAERFHLLPLALTALLLACALDVLRDRLSFPPKHLAVGAAALFVVRALLSYPQVREHHRPTTDLWLRDVLALAPPRAIILHSGDDRVGAFLYARCAVGLRPDVEAIAPVLLLTDWYPPRVSARLGIPVVHGERSPGKARPELASRALVDQLLRTDRPVFATDWFGSGLDRSVPSYPVGPLIRIVERRGDVPDPMTLVAMNDEAFAKIELEPTLPRPDTWAGARMLDYARPWSALASAFTAMGDEPRAEACRRRARALTPGSP